ncbi:MAG: xylulokinase [Clostridia bacterium]|nr:xylulokinase [Clostridia bacterium]
MNTYIGIDLGTSSVKLLLVSSSGRILSEATKFYSVSYPHPGWSEQSPEDWYTAVIAGLKDLLCGQDKDSVRGISFGGQMHGLVILNEQDEVIRPCILWNDGRTEKETKYLNETIGKANLSKYTGNIAFAGFTAPKLLWLKANEPENFARISKIMLPKDYIAYRLSGSFATDLSDASGMLLLDVRNRCWSKEMCGICGISVSQLPALHESYEVTGSLKKDIAEDLGLGDVKIIAGAGDNAAAAIGTGTAGDGGCTISLGTSGTLFVSCREYAEDKENKLHSFCHADGGYHLMGCILSAASCNGWWMERILETKNFAREQKDLDCRLGDNDVYFLPYLMGERSPHNDVNARGCFIGLRPDTDRKDMTLAVLEGVTFALKDCLEAARANGVEITRTKLCGGGAKSPLWRKIVADVMNMPVDIVETEQGPSYGGAMLAMVGCGEYASPMEAIRSIVHVKETILPDPEASAKYETRYSNFRRLYPALKGTFSELYGA